MREKKAQAKVAARERRPAILIPLSFLAALSALALAGCNTVSGVGEDVSAAGEAIDQTSERTQDRISGEESEAGEDYQAGRY